MKTTYFTSLLVTVSLLLSACGETQQRSGSPPADSAQADASRDGMVRIDSATAAQMAAGDTTVSGVRTMSATVWLGAGLVSQGGQIIVMKPPASSDRLPLQRGDAIEAINGTAVTSANELKQQYEQTAVGDTVRLTVRRAGEQQTLPFARPDSSNAPS